MMGLNRVLGLGEKIYLNNILIRFSLSMIRKRFLGSMRIVKHGGRTLVTQQ